MKIEELKEEAIKLVKSFFPYNKKGNIFTIKDFKEIFNITEEDLR